MKKELTWILIFLLCLSPLCAQAEETAHSAWEGRFYCLYPLHLSIEVMENARIATEEQCASLRTARDTMATHPQILAAAQEEGGMRLLIARETTAADADAATYVKKLVGDLRKELDGKAFQISDTDKVFLADLPSLTFAVRCDGRIQQYYVLVSDAQAYVISFTYAEADAQKMRDDILLRFCQL
ncbi:MAG: DcrB-related protein [Clostridia bacterium]